MYQRKYHPENNFRQLRTLSLHHQRESKMPKSNILRINWSKWIHATHWKFYALKFVLHFYLVHVVYLFFLIPVCISETLSCTFYKDAGGFIDHHHCGQLGSLVLWDWAAFCDWKFSASSHSKISTADHSPKSAYSSNIFKIKAWHQYLFSKKNLSQNTSTSKYWLTHESSQS